MVDIDPTSNDVAPTAGIPTTPAERRALRLEQARRNYNRDRYNPEAARSIPSFRESLQRMMKGAYRRVVPSAQDEKEKAA